MNRTIRFGKRLAALACALVLTVSLVPAASAVNYRSSWLGYGGHEFEVRLVFSSVCELTKDFTLKSYSPSGSLLSEPHAYIYAAEEGSEAEQIMGFENHVRYDGVTVTGCSVSFSGSTVEIRDSGVSMPLNTGDIMSKSTFGGYDAIRYYRVDHFTTGQTYDVIYYFLLGDTIDSANSSSSSSSRPSSSTSETPAANPNASEASCEQSGHDWTYGKVEPTCTSEGYSYRVCSVCGTEETYNIIQKLSHSWEIKTEQATTASAGRTYRVCKVCGTEETLSTISQKSHTGSGSTDMSKLSQAEITQLLKNAPLTLPENLYDSAPSTSAPYAAGKIKSSVLQSALNRLNALRRIAGLPSVALDASLCESAQYGAALLAACGQLSHTPSKPSGMDNTFYQKGYSATSSSNLAAGYTLTGAVDGWMDDSDAGNISRIGHRRWQLSTNMGKIGFGYCGYYAAEKVFDRSGSKISYDYIAWPASGSFPTELFDKNEAWSVSLNPENYAAPSGVTVTISGGGKTWMLSGNYTAASSGKYLNTIASDGYNYGGNHCIIFRPDGVGSYNGTYTVTISGLKDKSGASTTLTYDVDFFSAGASNQSASTPVQTTPEGQSDSQTTRSAEEQAAYEAMIALKDQYPEGTRWTNSNSYNWKGGIYSGGAGCAGFAFMLSDAAFGSLPARKSTNVSFSNVRVGDILRVNNDTHSVIVLEVQNDSLVIAEGNYNSSVHWGRTLSKSAVESATYLITRWPQDGATTPAKPTTPTTPDSASNPFTDVPAGSYYHDAVLWALENGVTTGVTATQFQPNATCTRGQVVTFLWRAKGCPEPKTKTNPFRDVSASSPFYKAILWAQENGITSGKTANTFDPSGTCTSAHVVTFLWRANEHPAASGSSALASTYSGQYYTDAVAWADSSGLLKGTGAAFTPNQNSPRANIVTYLYRDATQ